MQMAALDTSSPVTVTPTQPVLLPDSRPPGPAGCDSFLEAFVTALDDKSSHPYSSFGKRMDEFDDKINVLCVKIDEIDNKMASRYLEVNKLKAEVSSLK